MYFDELTRGDGPERCAREVEIAIRGNRKDIFVKILDADTQKNVQSVLRDAAASMETIRNILGDDENREQLSQAMKRLPGTLDSMNATFKATDETLRKFTERSKTDGKTAIERMVGTIEITERTLRKFTDPPREGDLAPADQIAKAMENIGEITTLMRSIMTRIDDGEGSGRGEIGDDELQHQTATGRSR